MSIPTAGMVLILVGGLGPLVMLLMLGMSRWGLKGDHRSAVVREEVHLRLR